MSGLEVQAALVARGLRWPVIMLTAHGDVASARNALKAGAFDFIEKPFDDMYLVATIARAAEDAQAVEARAAARRDVQRRLARLTRREREVLDLVVGGRHNREIAQSLGLSPRTVEVYKARVMDKLDVERLADLIRLTIDPAP
jgi:RNA polymerase sigma factor (sigma-70 family)